MTTSALSAVLPSVPKTQASSTNASSSGEGGFSAVLSDQSARQQATRTSQQQGQSPGQSGQPAGQATQAAASASENSPNTTQATQAAGSSTTAAETTQATEQPATAANDASMANQAAGQGLTLAQLTLNIAAEVAAVRGNATDATGQAASLATATLATQGGKAALQGEDTLAAALTATRNGDGAQNAETSIDPARALAAEQALANRANTASASPLAAGLLQAAQTSAGLQPSALATQTSLNSQQRTTQAAPVTGQAARLAGMKQAVLTAQQRLDATQNGQAQLPASDLFSALANAQGEPSDPVTQLGMQQDWLARQGATQGAGLQTAMGTTSLAGAAPQQPAVGVPLSSPQWGAEFGRQFVSIVQGGGATPHTAELRLDPPDLGPLRISISLSDSTAQASFVSPHAAVRQTVENALPQLQQMLAQAGISLGQTSVSDQGQPEQAFNQGASGDGGNSGNGNAGGSENGGLASVANAAARVMNPNALVDTFA